MRAIPRQQPVGDLLPHRRWSVAVGGTLIALTTYGLRSIAIQSGEQRREA
jgi:hypothetical protein